MAEQLRVSEIIARRNTLVGNSLLIHKNTLIISYGITTKHIAKDVSSFSYIGHNLLTLPINTIKV
jgi:hypothetical protein